MTSRKRLVFSYCCLALLLAMLFAVSLFWGSVALTPQAVLAALTGRGQDALSVGIITQLRLPRAVMAVLLGAALSAAPARPVLPDFAAVELVLLYTCRGVVLCSRWFATGAGSFARDFHQCRRKRCSGTRSQITDYSGSSIGLLRISQDLFFSIKLIYSCNKSVCPYNNLVSPCLHFAGQGLIFFN